MSRESLSVYTYTTHNSSMRARARANIHTHTRRAPSRDVRAEKVLSQEREGESKKEEVERGKGKRGGGGEEFDQRFPTQLYAHTRLRIYSHAQLYTTLDIIVLILNCTRHFMFFVFTCFSCSQLSP